MAVVVSAADAAAAAVHLQRAATADVESRSAGGGSGIEQTPHWQAGWARQQPARHVVTTFACGPAAEVIAALPPAEAVARALHQLDSMFGARHLRLTPLSRCRLSGHRKF